MKQIWGQGTFEQVPAHSLFNIDYWANQFLEKPGPLGDLEGGYCVFIGPPCSDSYGEDLRSIICQIHVNRLQPMSTTAGPCVDISHGSQLGTLSDHLMRIILRKQGLN